MKNILTFFLAVFCLSTLHGQDLVTRKISATMESGNLHIALESLGKQIGVRIICIDTSAQIQVDENFKQVLFTELLGDLLKGTTLHYLIYRDYLVVVADRTLLNEHQPASFYQTLQESIVAVNNTADQEEIVIGEIEQAARSVTTAVNGKVVDIETGEEIFGATLLIRETGQGTDTDENGDFNLTLKPGSYSLLIQYIGFRERQIPIRVISSGKLDLTLSKGSILLDEVVVAAKKRDENIQSTQVGVSRISIREIEKLPSFLGEVDIIKGILQQPGVSTIGEGSSGFNVRGGTVDQNLILMDEAMIFNSSHALGFFSSFNSDILSDAVLHKGNIPGKFGGRLASVLDVNLRDGNFEKLRFKGGLGIVSSRLTLEGPITPNKTSFLISGRSTYSDWLLKSIKIPEVSSSSAFFYDANVKLTHRLNERNFISLAGYATADEFTYANEFGFDYQTLMGQINFRSAIGNHLYQHLALFTATTRVIKLIWRVVMSLN
ncbi:MAG: TonB-dependent receptor [Saprospiraceae bacterium]|nr:TonB-dependent receptor [Saprospiraceae bacterium]